MNLLEIEPRETGVAWLKVSPDMKVRLVTLLRGQLRGQLSGLRLLSFDDLLRAGFLRADYLRADFWHGIVGIHVGGRVYHGDIGDSERRSDL